MEIYEKQDICLRCMSPLNGASRCPKCGFDLEKYKPKKHHLKPRTILHGQYIIGCALGEGGFGITYVGWDLHLHMMVAVKEYYPVGIVMRDNSENTVTVFSGADEEFFRHDRSKFMSEAQKLAKFDGNPGVVSVKNYFMENGTAYIVMEYIQGINLSVFTQQNGGKLSMAQAMKLLDLPIQTLSELHKAKTFHRDISPENLMVTNSGAVKLIDFGSAMDHNVDTKTRTLKVRPGYSPIELYTPEGKEDSYTDIYALCATIYKTITGIVPPMAPERVTEDKLVPPSKLGVKGITPRQEKALMKGLSVNSTSRYQSVDDLYKDLKVNTESRPQFSGRMILAFGIVAALAIGSVVGIQALKPDPVQPAITAEPTAVPTDEPAIAFTSPEFEQVLRVAIGRTHGESIYSGDLDFVESLTIDGDQLILNEIVDADLAFPAFPLDDLKHFGKLKNLKISINGNMQSDGETALKALSALEKLETLTIYYATGNNSTVSMAELANAPSLKNLNLSMETCIMLDFGSGIPALETLVTGHDSLSSIAFGENMTSLREVTITRMNGMEDYTFVSSLPALEYFEVWGEAETMDFGEGSASLKYLHIDDNYALTDLNIGANTTNLTTLRLYKGHFGDISFIHHLDQLEFLAIETSAETLDFTGLYPNLKALHIYDNSLTSLELGDTREALANLWVQSEMTDLSYLADAPNLIALGIDQLSHAENPIDLSPIAPLTSLQSLRLLHDGISDVSPLSGLTNLTYLQIRSTLLEDLSPLSSLNIHDNHDFDTPHADFSTLYGEHTEDRAVQFASPEFERLLREDWGLNENDPIYPEQLAMVREMTIGGGKISTTEFNTADTDPTEMDIPLDDLQYFSGLMRLSIHVKSTSDSFVDVIAQLKQLNELIVFVDGFGMGRNLDLSAWGEIPWLQQLSIDAHGVQTVNFGDSGFNDLRALYFGSNELTEVHIGSGAMQLLKEFNCYWSSLSDVSFIRNIPWLETFRLFSHSDQLDVSPLRDTGIAVVQIDSNGLNDLSPLADMPNLRKVSLSADHALDTSPLEGRELKRLEVFDTLQTP